MYQLPQRLPTHLRLFKDHEVSRLDTGNNPRAKTNSNTGVSPVLLEYVRLYEGEKLNDGRAPTFFNNAVTQSKCALRMARIKTTPPTNCSVGISNSIPYRAGGQKQHWGLEWRTLSPSSNCVVQQPRTLAYSMFKY